MRSILLCISTFALAIVATGCNKQIQSFVGHGSFPSLSPIVQTSNPIPMKISPAANIVKGLQVTTLFDVTPTQQTVTGTQVSSSFSFYQNRPE